MKRKLRILVLMHEDIHPPATLDGCSPQERLEWQSEYDVMTTLRRLGHEPKRVGLYEDVAVLRSAIEDHRPHIAWNLLDEFHGLATFDQHVVSLLELLKLPYTGCNPRGLTIARDKALTKKILAYHRIRVPKFAVFARGKRVRAPREVAFPLFVKSLTDDASIAVAQASIVHDEGQLRERVDLVHRSVGTDAIAEEYIDGRELYVAVVGNKRPRSLPVWELYFDKLPEGAPRIATRKLKWDYAFQKKSGLDTGPARDLPPELSARVLRKARRAYQLLGLSGYARLDFRLSADGKLYLLEANPNPYIADGEDFADSALAAGIGYEELLTLFLRLGLRYRRELFTW